MCCSCHSTVLLFAWNCKQQVLLVIFDYVFFLHAQVLSIFLVPGAKSLFCATSKALLSIMYLYSFMVSSFHAASSWLSIASFYSIGLIPSVFFNPLPISSLTPKYSTWKWLTFCFFFLFLCHLVLVMIASNFCKMFCDIFPGPILGSYKLLGRPVFLLALGTCSVLYPAFIFCSGVHNWSVTRKTD